MKAFGMDPTSESYQNKCLSAAELLGQDVVEVCKKDIERSKRLFNKENYTDEELKEGCGGEEGQTLLLVKSEQQIATPLKLPQVFAPTSHPQP